MLAAVVKKQVGWWRTVFASSGAIKDWRENTEMFCQRLSVT